MTFEEIAGVDGETEVGRQVGPAPLARRTPADPDAALVAAAQADPAAFLALYEQYFPRVHGYVRLRIRDRTACEDVTSQVFLTALAEIGRFRGEGPFAAWLFRIAQHAVPRAGRAALPPGSQAPEDGADPGAGVPDGAPGPEEVALARERQATLRVLLATLDPAQQHLLALRFGAGLKTGEIARVLGKSGVAVRVSLHRTLRSLRRRYHDEA